MLNLLFAWKWWQRPPINMHMTTLTHSIGLSIQHSRIKHTTRKLLFYYDLWKPAYARSCQEILSKLHHKEKISEQSSIASWTAYFDIGWLMTSHMELGNKLGGFHLLAVLGLGPRDTDRHWGGLVTYHCVTLHTKKIIINSQPTTFEALVTTDATCWESLVILFIYRLGFLWWICCRVGRVHSLQLANGCRNRSQFTPTGPKSSNHCCLPDQFGLIQHVEESTHWQGGWLNVIITRDDCTLSDLQVSPPTISDHGLIMAAFLHDTPSTITKCIRRWRGLDWEAFRAALMKVPVIVDPSWLADLTVEEAFVHYETAVGGVIDRLLQMHTVNICQCPSSSWFDKECRTLRHQACRH